jgi:hypothetical protein
MIQVSWFDSRHKKNIFPSTAVSKTDPAFNTPTIYVVIKLFSGDKAAEV